jgi:hypothetical protein
MGSPRAFNRGSNVYSLLSRYGGIRPRTRCRSARALALAEREEQRSPSTLSREIRCNGGRVRYRPSEADQQALKKARRPKRCWLACRPELRELVEEKLQENWAPQQVTGWLKRTYPGDEFYRVSHETIYRSLCSLSAWKWDPNCAGGMGAGGGAAGPADSHCDVDCDVTGRGIAILTGNHRVLSLATMLAETPVNGALDDSQ